MRKAGRTSALCEANERELFSRQSAHSVIIDAMHPGANETTRTITDAMRNFFSIVCCLSGPCRIPAFSMSTSFSSPEKLFPMQKISKSIFSQINFALQELLSPRSTQYVGRESAFSDVEHAIRESAVNYARFKELTNFTGQLEITVFTNKCASEVRLTAGMMVRNLNLSEIKKIEFLCLAKSEDRIWSENAMEINSQELSSSDGNELDSIWNVVQMECNSVCIDNYFRQWLKDECTDKENMRLDIGNGITIKCDLQDRVINPDELPFRSLFYAGSDLFVCTVPQGARGQNKAEKVPVLHFKVKKVIPNDVVCESITFGHPVVLVSSACWQMDWEELEANQGHFLALCKRLSTRNQCLLCENLTKQHGRHRNYSLNNINQPKGLFVVIPTSSSASLLLKPISTKELLLPTRTDHLPDDVDIPSSATANVDAALKCVGETNEFNPLEYESGLCQSLITSLTPRTTGGFSRPVPKKPRMKYPAAPKFAS